MPDEKDSVYLWQVKVTSENREVLFHQGPQWQSYQDPEGDIRHQQGTLPEGLRSTKDIQLPVYALTTENARIILILKPDGDPAMACIFK